MDRIRRELFGSALDAAITVLAAFTLISLSAAFFDWGVADATWSTGPEACRAASGACWSFIQAKFRFILFGTYPSAEQWRPLAAMAIILGALAASANPRWWRPRVLLVWVASLGISALLMWGGAFGLNYVPHRLWGGLPLTFLLAVVSLAVAFPVSVLLALGRRSNLPVIRAACTVLIEIVRGVPLVSLLFMALIIVPIVFPAGFTVDKLLRALLALTLFAAAYLAEVVRGGLQAIPKGQYEAAAALGLGYWRTVRFIVLPQALRVAIPPLTSTFIVMIKNTALVLVIGLFDLFNAAKVATTDPAWAGYFAESYVFVASIYFVICYSVSRYSRYLEQRFSLNSTSAK